MRKRVLLGFSGGVDSCASASILREGGYDVTPVLLETTSDPRLADSAREAARRLGMTLRIIDVKDIFRKEVVDYFIAGYMRGETPAPCTVCNGTIKWRTLYETAVAEKYDHIATGHYFRIREEDGKFYVRKGADPVKDQSYYLWGLTQQYLGMALTPMGDKIKEEIKKSYGQFSLSRESMGVCFLQGMNCTDFLREQSAGAIRKGDVVNMHGEVVGSHDGFPLYTIGQKKGLDTQVPGAVVDIDVVNNRIVIGNDAQLYHRNLCVEKINIPDIDRLVSSEKISVKIRGLGRNPAGYAHVTFRDEDTLIVHLEEPAWACAKGQPVVFYEGDFVVGGGFLRNYW